jgi:hypothetical protein
MGLIYRAHPSSMRNDMKNMYTWFVSRLREPSTYAGFAIAAVGVAVVMSNTSIAIAGIVIAALAFVVHERIS